MKVICAGFPKTGTKTIAEALRILGYKVHDVEEQFRFLAPDLEEMVEKGGTAEDFRRVYSGVEAVSDMPSCHIWQELHWAFPDAKIILTLRETEDTWWRSFENQLRVGRSNRLATFLLRLSPTGRKFTEFNQKMLRYFFGSKAFRPWTKSVLSGLVSKMRYRQHNQNVIASTPKDKLLVFQVSEGWGPLCKFLDQPVPDQEFPHKNKNGVLFEETLFISPTFSRIKREIIAFSTLAFVILAVVFKLLI